MHQSDLNLSGSNIDPVEFARRMNAPKPANRVRTMINSLYDHSNTQAYLNPNLRSGCVGS